MQGSHMEVKAETQKEKQHLRENSPKKHALIPERGKAKESLRQMWTHTETERASRNGYWGKRLWPDSRSRVGAA